MAALSWRDVYRAVGESEQRVLAALHTIDSRVDSTMAEHEGRAAVLARAEAKRIDLAMLAEAKRIDALLSAAASAVSLASNRAEVTAATLAERVDTSAKALASQVEATAKAAALAVEATAKALSMRIEPLEQARYEQAGRRGLSQPLLVTISAAVGGLALYIVESLLKVAP